MNISGTIRPPGDKSITHRALLLAALAPDESAIRGALAAADTRRTAHVLRRLGVRVSPVRHDATVRVRGGVWRAPAETLHCGNSGTTARLLLGLLAARRFTARLTGDASLRRRPMRRITEPLVRMGATIREENGDHLPLRITGGPLVSLEWTSPVASSQIKTALLFAGLAAGVRVVVREPVRSRDHTERLMLTLGCPLSIDGTTVVLERGTRRLPPLAVTVPGDASSAAFLVAAALLGEAGELTVTAVGVNPTRTGFLRVLERMRARVSQRSVRIEAGEPVADLTVRPSALHGTEVTAEEIPSLIDEVPVLAILAGRAVGDTVFRDVGELRVKESDRLGLLAANLRAVGIAADVLGDDLLIRGAGSPPRGRVETGGDHRLAMAFAVLGTVPDARVVLSERESPAVSYPAFFRDLRRIGGR